jgi:uncharacterized protein involved in exopolysaccharide biosynthesis
MLKSGERTTGSVARSARVRPRLGALDMAVQLWRAKWLMLAVFTPLCAAGLAVAFALPQSFTATSRILVSAGDTLAYGAAEVSAPAELELLRSPVVAQKVLAKVTLARAYPDIARGCKPEACEGLGIAAITRDLSVTVADMNPVLTAEFRHAHAAMSAELLNAMIEAYLGYRADINTDTRTDDFREQRERFEQDLAEADQAIRAYLATNNLTDHAAERDTLRGLYQSASGELLVAQSRLRQAEAQLANYRVQIDSIAPEQDLYVEDSSQQTLLALQLERQEKLSRYRAGSRVIEELDRRIEQAEAFLDTHGNTVGIVRRGPNPLYQQVEASIATLQSEVQALGGQVAELKSQIAAFEGRQRRLVELEPALQELERSRQVAEKAAVAFSEREVDARARSEMTRRGASAIRVLEPATPPVEGASLTIPVTLLTLIIASLAALAAGLMRAVTRSGFATPGSVERTLGLPVVAAIQTY